MVCGLSQIGHIRWHRCHKFVCDANTGDKPYSAVRLSVRVLGCLRMQSNGPSLESRIFMLIALEYLIGNAPFPEVLGQREPTKPGSCNKNVHGKCLDNEYF